MFVLAALVMGAFVAMSAAWLAAHDAQGQRWYRQMGYRPIAKLVALDLTVSLLTYAFLTAAAGSGWHGLAVAGLVTPRTEVGVASLILPALTALGGGLALITARMPAGSRRQLMKRLAGVRERYLDEIAAHYARQQTRDHVDNVLPGFRALHQKGSLHLEARAFARSVKVDAEATERLVQLARAGDDDSLLTLAADISETNGGRQYISDLIAKLNTPQPVAKPGRRPLPPLPPSPPRKRKTGGRHGQR